MTNLPWSPDFYDFTLTRTERSLSAHHVSAIAKHGDANEGVGVRVPIHDGLVILPRTASYAFVFLGQLSLTNGSKFLGFLCFAFAGQIDMSNFEVHCRHQVNARNL